MDDNGHTNASDLNTYALQPEVTAFIDALQAETPALSEYRDLLFHLAGFAASRGYVQSQENLRKRTIPITLTEPLTGYVKLEGQEAAAFLAELGLG